MENDLAHPKNIYIIGAQCTGKTTLVDALIRHFHDVGNRVWHGSIVEEPIVIKEVARNVLREHNFTAFDITSSADRALQLQHLILEAQHQAERTAAARWFISDRSGIDPIIYARMYSSEDAALEMMRTEKWMELSNRMRSASIFLCEAVPSWLYDDGTRLVPKELGEWEKCQRAFREVLDRLGIGYTIVGQDNVNIDKRVDLVIGTWAAYSHDSRVAGTSNAVVLQQ